uniref:Uncharacterized protein n=1 Tax=viral metagenome TaxID=1070528 RepID=A0A6C0ACK9_9ZZZZ
MDNFYHECPAEMSDGRIFSEFKTATRRNEYIKYVNGIYSNDQYRLFLQENGKQLSDNIFNYYKTNENCRVNPCVHNHKTARVTPEDMADEMKRYNQRAMNNYRTDKKNKGCIRYKDFRLN